MNEPELSVMPLPVGRWVSYLQLAEGEVHRTVEIHPNLLIDVDNSGNLLGVEVLGPVNLSTDHLYDLEAASERYDYNH